MINRLVSDGRKGKRYLQPPLTTLRIATSRCALLLALCSFTHTPDTSRSRQSLFGVKSSLWFAGTLFANAASDQLVHNVRGGVLGWRLFLEEAGNAPGSSCGRSSMGHLCSHLQTCSQLWSLLPVKMWGRRRGETQTETSSLKSLPSGLRRRIYNVVVFLTDKQRNVGFFLFLRVWCFFSFYIGVFDTVS